MTDHEGNSSQLKPAQANQRVAKPETRHKTHRKTGKARAVGAKRTRTPRIYPALSFEESLTIADAIQNHASGEKIARLTLLKQMNLSPTSSATQILITSSTKYGLTKGSYAAEHLELTADGRIATDRSTPDRVKAQVRFDLAIKGITPFDVIYSRYRGKKLPAHDVLKDTLGEAKLEIADAKECIDTFVVNAKFLGLLQTIAGSETLVPIETLVEQLPDDPTNADATATQPIRLGETPAPAVLPSPVRSSGQWQRICFYVTPIGADDSEERRHSDMFLSSLIEPALSGFGLEVVRADKIAQPGMITSQVLEHILRSRLVIADLSFHNPNVFYEVALRHATRLPVVQICRKKDRLPFDVNQVRTISLDTTDIYSLIPKLETYRSEIASQVRAALDGQGSSNPISVFFPGFSVTVPKTT